ncbi:hypothetical protein HKX54_18020 [Sulfitobacter sp. M57]|jgi:hypothetical protein|uniref:hypothetical protein n=1 Tax=unclassified Sulfitobacter TaxID=196795 RepID=UPI0023E0B216|nr:MULTISPECIES: hypothetical protein [unclassified Sulfitobacter]MDF3416369.1 hypothetical protein [Sulfitobacter sp. KE5]MDF3423848.1 hypothetical protein [Sulfitobacter sp. KE43]MDF3434915.1 hypothetical protein [Sulfitobacter sp. KE42]MDF3460554.1 hypothetical protein [Sulfitobacter sp. S74]MDF3464452.1 hypothetical protein [Sulfitobacter sp. Ks18]
MQRAKHADRKQETRAKIMIGEAAMRVGASHLPVEEIEAVLAHYIETGGSKKLQAFVMQRTNSLIKQSANGGSEANRRSGAKIETIDRAKSVLQ